MEKNYAIVASCVTVGEFKKLIEDLPNDAIITWGGVPEFYINVLNDGKAVCLDEENIIEWDEEEA